MDAVCFAEHLALLDRIELYHATHVTRVIEEFNQKEAKKRSLIAEKLNIKRHANSNQAMAKVIEDWEKDRYRFPSAERAGSYYVDWLAEQGSTYEQRTVVDWIREHARKIGVKFR
jgi:hypothetical protein